MSDPLSPLLDILLSPTPITAANYKDKLIASPYSDAIYCTYPRFGCHHAWGVVYWVAENMQGVDQFKELRLKNNLKRFNQQLAEKINATKLALEEYPKLLDQRKGFDAGVQVRFHKIDQMLLKIYSDISYALQYLSKEELAQRFTCLTEIFEASLVEERVPIAKEEINTIFDVRVKLWNFSGVRLLNYYLAHPVPKAALEQLIVHLIDPRSAEAGDKSAIDQFVTDIKMASEERKEVYLVRSLHKALFTVIETMDVAKGRDSTLLLAQLECELRTRGCDVFEQSDPQFQQEVYEFSGRKILNFQREELKIGKKIRDNCFEIEDHPNDQVRFSASNPSTLGIRELSLQHFAKQWDIRRIKMNYLDPEGKYALYERGEAFATEALSTLNEEARKQFKMSFASEMAKVIKKGFFPAGKWSEILVVDENGNVKWEISSEDTRQLDIDGLLEIEGFYLACNPNADNELYLSWMQTTGLGAAVLARQCRANIITHIAHYQVDRDDVDKNASPQPLPLKIKEAAGSISSRISEIGAAIRSHYEVSEKVVKNALLTEVKQYLDTHQAITKISERFYNDLATDIPKNHGYKLKSGTLVPMKGKIIQAWNEATEQDRANDRFFHAYGIYNSADIKQWRLALSNKDSNQPVKKKLFKSEP